MNPSLKNKIEQLIKSDKVFLFMKGTPDNPMCGFSAQTVQVLKENNINFKSFNIFDDEEIRQGIKEYSNWPTIPQLFVGGKFVGGCDIITEMAENGELQEMVR